MQTYSDYSSFNLQMPDLQYMVLYGVGLSVIVYLISSIYNVEEECDRVIKVVTSVVRGEVQSIKNVAEDENPYDLFTRIYPVLKNMDNDRINEFTSLIQEYNSNWSYVEEN